MTNIFIICGKTDMRKGIDGLATLIQDSFELDPYGDPIFLFAGSSKDRYKYLYFDGGNGVDFYEYIKKLFTDLPNQGIQQNPKILDQYMPCSKKIRAECSK
ncbi:IS66 family insertion sequence element accessory protein TnpB [Bacillaceae bacterium S4-13-56]